MTSLSTGNSFLTAYLEENKKLIQTLVIKSETSAALLNEAIISKYGETAVDKYDPTTWKYYLNLAGLPHFTDTYMNVISLDTLETIEFSHTNLLKHTATAKAYSYGSRYFYSLLRKYPTQEALIRGVITPVDIYDAIEAKDGAILGHPAGLVETQELSLIEDLEVYIQSYLSRWHVPGYQTTDPYYSMVQWYILATQLYPRLLNLRQARCHTNEVHSFHIREYLASHGKLDRYIPYLTLEQKLYLYRNIRYLEHHSGTVEQFTELVQRLLISRDIPLAEYSINQINEFDNDKYINILAKKKSIGASRNVTKKEYVDIVKVYDKERSTVYGNPRYLTAMQATDTKKFRVANSTVIQTKDLESSMVDSNNAVPDPLLEVLLRQWAHMAFHGLYPVLVYYTDPTTGEFQGLTALDAFIYFNYINLRQEGLELTHLPKFTNVKFRRHPKPSIDELLRLIPAGMSDLVPVAEQLISQQPILKVCQSVDQFYTQAFAVYEESLKHWFLVSNTHDMVRCSIIRQMVLKLYGMELMDFGSSETLEEWRVRVKLPKYTYNRKQADELSTILFNAATGYSIDSSTQLKYVQKYLLELFGQLSSYSIQLLRETNESDIIPLNAAAIRLGNITEEGSSVLSINDPISINGIESRGQTSLGVITSSCDSVHSVDVVHMESVDIASGVNLNLSTSYIEAQPVFNTGTVYDVSYDLFDPAISGKATYIGAEYFELLTEEQKRSLKHFK